MRNITRICFALALAAFCVMSCHRELEISPVQELPELEGDGIVLKLDVGEMDKNTRVDAGTRPGDDDGAFNENVLGNAVDVFFFPEGATDATQSSFSTSASVAASATGGNLSIPVNAQRISTIFGGTAPGNKCLVYVVANYNGSAFDHENGSYTLGALKAMPLAKAVWSTFPQEKFVMTGSDELTLVDASKSVPASGQIRMRRVASKVTFKLTVADEIVVENVQKDMEGNITKRTLETWHPLKDAMTVYLQYSMNYARLDGTPLHVPANPKSDEAKDSLYTFDPNKLARSATKTIARDRTIIDSIIEPTSPEGEWEVVSHHEVLDVPVYDTKVQDLSTDGPFYSYPVTWEPGVQTEPFLKLIIPWNNGSRTKYYYYKVPFSVTELKSNNWYEVTLDVQILGGEDTQPVPLEATYKVVDWVPGTTSEASVVNARYLSVPKTEWIMYNTEELTIPITSSHDVQIVGYQVKSNGTGVNRAFAAADKYSNGQPRAEAWIGSDPSIYNPFTDNLVTTGVTSTTTVGPINAAKPDYSANNPAGTTISAASWFDAAEITQDHIILRHTLNNDTSTGNYDVAPYYIRIRVRHKDDYSYYKDIIIEQRPAIVIEPQQNTDGTSSSHSGYVFVDGNQTGGNGWNQLITITSGSNRNPNMYVISTSVLPADSERVIGDPRSLTAKTDGQLYNGWDSRDAAFVGRTGYNTRDLTYYYDTDDSSKSDNFIAPVFRIASSHGQSGQISYQNAVRRCASYQEDGYPAGRWRLPTREEVLYITQLSQKGMIPELFTFYSNQQRDRAYWCANGAIDGVYGTPTYYEIDDYNRNVRCVYDEWFWENTTYATVDRTTFTWGDQTRESVVRTRATE